MNNPNWCCEQIEELIKKYRQKREDAWDYATYIALGRIIEDLERILYG